jgi:carbon-monoxide dehydrogenase medium subunit
MAGGTEVMVLIRDGIIKPRVLVDLWPLKSELSYVKREGNLVRIGALTTISDIAESFLVEDRRYLGFLDLVKHFATPYLRNSATIGGNIGCAHPMSDAAILLLALDTQVRFVSTDGERVVPLENAYAGLRRLAKEPNEVIAEVFFRELPENSSTALIKFDRRHGHGMGYVVVAAFMELDGDVIKDVRVAFDSVGDPYPGRVTKTEEFLKGKVFSEEVLDRVCEEILPREMRRISDYRASAEYRLELSKVLMKKALLLIKERIKGGD